MFPTMVFLQDTRPSVVTFNYNRLRPGTHVVSFQAIAATVGNWKLPPVQAFADRQPEVMGLSTSGEFEICSDEEESGCREVGVDEIGLASGPPKPCPGNCNRLGLCDLSTGKCLCDVGFTGDDCGKIEAQR